MATHQHRQTLIAGVDEAGRGPLAGPVVAAAVILRRYAKINDLRDSKKTTPRLRKRLFQEICEKAITVGVGIVDSTTIDRVNIFRATQLAMRDAVRQLARRPSLILVDGLFPIPSISTPQVPIPKGDETVPSISAASIIAKVIRDQIMEEFDTFYPRYGFKRHKGYGTPEHILAIFKLGPTAIHRLSFQPLKGAL